jgi:hypothetical protein
MSHPADSLGIPSSSASARIRFPTLHQERGSTNPRRLPPTGSTVSPGSRRPITAWTATGTGGSSPTTQLPTCVHAPTQGALDPTAYRLFTGAERPHAACQLLQRTVARARHRPVRPPVEKQRTTFHQMATSLSVRHQPSFLRSGVTWLASPRRPPPHATARCGGFTPT